MSLHPEVLKEIDRLAKWYADHYKIGLSVRDDMRHVVALAVEKEREGLRDSLADVLIETDATWSVSEALAVADEAIRRRGKP